MFDILGLKEEKNKNNNDSVFHDATNILLDIRAKAKANKDWATADYIRDRLMNIGLTIKDTKDGAVIELRK